MTLVINKAPTLALSHNVYEPASVYVKVCSLAEGTYRQEPLRDL